MPARSRPLPPALATEGFPEDLDRVLARRVDPAVPRDNAWRADGRDLPLNRWSWGERDVGAMAEVWDAEADRLADELIEMWRWAWVWFMPRAARERHPELVERVRKLVADHRVAPDLVRASDASERIEMTIEWALWFGAHDLVRQRRDWPDPPADATCAICGATFVPALGSEWIFRVYGVERYCGACIGRAIGGVQTTSRARIRRGLRRLAALLGCPPPANLRRSLSIAALPAERRDAFMCALMTAPAATVPPYASHLAALQDAGLVGEAWRPGRGTICQAADGHLCLSLGERAIDDWLTARGLPHEREPLYPPHPDLNPDGARRADWLLSDGTLVEYAGMLGNADYAARFAVKQALAAATGARVIVLRPDDLYALDEVFAPVLAEFVTERRV